MFCRAENIQIMRSDEIIIQIKLLFFSFWGVCVCACLCEHIYLNTFP